MTIIRGKMPSSIRPKGSGSGPRPPPVTPMSERQQMALLMQMTSSSGESGSRSPSGAGSSRSRDRNERGETPLHLAAIKGDVEQVCKLLAHRADPNVADFAGWTPLHEACNHGWLEVAYRLVQAGANVNARGLDNDTPLHDAASNGHLKLVKLLVERGGDIHAKNSKGKSPVDIAAAGTLQYLLNPNLPISETAVTTRLPPRSRDEKKISEVKKCPSPVEPMDTKPSNTQEDVYEFKSLKESSTSPDPKNSEAIDVGTESVDSINVATAQPQEEGSSKRQFSEISDPTEETATEEESKRKKRKDTDNAKDTVASTSQRSSGPTNKAANKPAAINKSNTLSAAKSSSTDRKSPCASPKPAAATSDAEVDDVKPDLKVPPLKIVIPQSTTNEQETGNNRNGKNNSQRAHQALPYVVASSNSNDSTDKELTSGTTSPTENATIVKSEDKKDGTGQPLNDDQRSGHHQRVLRSSHRSGPTQGNNDRSSNNSSPQLQRSHSPSPSASPAAPNSQEATPSTSQSNAPSKPATDLQTSLNVENDGSGSSGSGSASSTNPAPVELHPRKRKMRPNKENPTPQPTHEISEVSEYPELHPHEQPTTNCYQLFLNIRKQIDKRRRGLFPVQPKPPQGFKDYLMNRCTYVLAKNASTPTITIPASLPTQMRELFTEQEKERYRLRMQHVVEKEKLVLSVEQEILRVHGRAARALASLTRAFSVCTILRDEEVYNVITPEQEEKDRNARSRHNGRLFLSWLQDVDDKWEKIKEHMLLRHHNEAESLHAVQKMDWEWKLKEMALCEYKATPQIDDLHVPMVHVSDDFDLLPA